MRMATTLALTMKSKRLETLVQEPEPSEPEMMKWTPQRVQMIRNGSELVEKSGHPNILSTCAPNPCCDQGSKFDI